MNVYSEANPWDDVVLGVSRWWVCFGALPSVRRAFGGGNTPVFTNKIDQATIKLPFVWVDIRVGVYLQKNYALQLCRLFSLSTLYTMLKQLYL